MEIKAIFLSIFKTGLGKGKGYCRIEYLIICIAIFQLFFGKHSFNENYPGIAKKETFFGQFYIATVVLIKI